MDSSVLDCVIIGGGVSGLSAAMELKKKGNLSFCILEASNRVGGKLFTVLYDTKEEKELSQEEYIEKVKEWKAQEFKNINPDQNYFIADLGGQWIGAEHNLVKKLLKDLQIPLFKQYEKGKSIMKISESHSVVRYNGFIPFGINPIILLELQRVFWKLDSMAKEVPLEDPWNAKEAKFWDSQTVYSFLQANTWNAGSRQLLTLILQSVMSATTSEVSLLSCLAGIKAAGGIDEMMKGVGGAQDAKILGGAQVLPLSMLWNIGEGHVHYNSEVLSIEQLEDQSCCIIRCKNGTIFRTKTVIVALSPNLCGRIHYTPPLPGKRDRLCQKTPNGHVIKLAIIFKSKWWRSNGFSGFFMSGGHIIEAGYDACDEAGHGFNCLMLGTQAYEFSSLSQGEREKVVITQLSELFLQTEEFIKSQFVALLCKDWLEEPFARGAYEGFFTTGTLTMEGSALRQNIGNIFFAGTETALHYKGYIDGAIEAGMREANRVIRSLE